MALLEYHFVIPNDLMNLGNEHQCCRKHKRIDKLTLVTSWQKMRAPPVFLKKKKIKISEINLTKDEKTCTLKNAKKLMKETREDTNKWRSQARGIRINIPKCPYNPKKSRFSAIPISILVVFFYRKRTNILKICMEPQTLNSQSNSEKKEQSWRHHTPDFNHITKLYLSNSMCGIKTDTKSVE